MKIHRLVLIVVSMLVGLGALTARAQTPEIAAKLILPAEAAAGTTVPVEVEVTLGREWHINSHQPTQDWLKATDAAIEASAGRVLGIEFPPHALKTFEFSDEPLAVYEGTFKIRAQLEIPATAPATIDVRAAVSYQACDHHQCFRPSEVVATATIRVSGGTAAAASAVPATTPSTESPAPTPATSEDPGQRYGVMGVPTVVFLGTDGQEVPGTRLVAMENSEKFLARLDRVESGGGEIQGDFDIASEVGRRGWLLTFLAIFLLGLALNLTPCVYPVIPITIGYFSHQTGGASRGRTFGMALLYVLGMALTYSAMGVAAALSGDLFGSALQSPWAVGAIAAILVALALSMFGLYEIQPPQAILRAAGSKSGVFGALFMGALVGFVAAPCIGPVVLGLLTYVASTKSVLIGFSMFFVLALGLGLPYLVLAVTSASLPRAGGWMIAVKHVFGVLMLAAAAWIAKSLPGISRYRDGFWLPAAVLLVGAIWFLFFEKEGRDRRGFRAGLALFAIAMAIVGGWLLVPSTLAWQPYSPAAVEQARRDGKRVILDFYADWCIPCKELDRWTFSNPKVAARLEGYVRLKVDLTHSDVKAQP